MKIFVREELCNGCRLCLKKCNYEAITIVEKKAVIGQSCTFCNLCVESCPQKAIQLTMDDALPINDSGDIWVFIEKNTKSCLEESSLEIVSKMKNIYTKADKKIAAIYISEKVTESEIQQIYSSGATTIIHIPLSESTYVTEKYSSILYHACQIKSPFMFLFSATEIGRDLAPRLATLLDTGLTADCTELSMDPEKNLLIQTRPAFSGDLMASIICPNHRPMMATIRPHSFKKDSFLFSETEFESMNLPATDFSATSHLLNIVHKNAIKSEYPLLEDQRIIVSVGRGIGSLENLQLVEAFARSIGAGIACSRPIVDLGWLPSELQVGMSGKSCSPKLYIALGISGSVQHLVGIQSAEYVIAVNKDENAPIFKVAHLGIVGNIKDVLPELKKKIIKDE